MTNRKSTSRGGGDILQRFENMWTDRAGKTQNITWLPLYLEKGERTPGKLLPNIDLPIERYILKGLDCTLSTLFIYVGEGKGKEKMGLTGVMIKFPDLAL